LRLSMLATIGNLNNELGVPLTLLRLDGSQPYAVIEMGMSARGEIAYLTTLAEPEVGLVTQIAPAHLEQLGSIAAITRAKGELFHGLATGGTAIYPDNDDGLAEEARAAAHRVTFGESERADVRLVQWESVGSAGADITLALGGQRHTLRLALVGRHNARNAAAAAAAALVLGRAPADIVAGLAKARPAKDRSEVVEVGGRKVLVDLYNANPTSTRAALDAVASLRGPARSIAVLGDMLELGPTGPELHRAVGAHAQRVGFDAVIGVGELGREIVAGARAAGMSEERAVTLTDKREAAALAAAWAGRGDWIVIKGSRGIRMEQVLEALQEELD
jgi:UDP-N-acetylmuramoyl-tripeptide--D-alanyl-D-alanine ligase